MQCCGLIVAGGKGSRFGQNQPKQYLTLLDRPLLIWSLQAFQACEAIGAIVIVVTADQIDLVAAWLKQYQLNKVVKVCVGGAERTDSVQAGLAALPADTEIVAIHDAARPLISPPVIERAIAAAIETGAALPVLAVRDTVKQGDAGLVRTTLDRRTLYLAQTPQTFRVDLIRKAYAAVSSMPGSASLPITDDAQMVEQLGHPVRLVKGDSLNFKVTVPTDFQLAEAILRHRVANGDKEHDHDIGKEKPMTQSSAPRIGMGYDVHRLVAGRKLILGGVEVPFNVGLLGHSDADVLCHAISDALLGAANLGDIGQHFPPTDMQYKGACSLDLLARVYRLVQQAGFILGNIDAVIVCQRPKLAPHLPAMRENLAGVLRISPSGVSIKATTTEGLGFAGTGEGIAAYATVLLQAG